MNHANGVGGERPIRVIRNTWIPLSDGIRLAARIWLPVDAESNPVPAILEYLPYRKNDGTAPRDARLHPYFAAHGYAAVRVDMRGSGDSDGILRGEYLPQEQEDALEILAWIAAQPWCSGSIGMMGISWGGFNSLQVAARRPPELKAIVTVCSTDDRYADDVHYMGGCVLGSDMLNWASIMFTFNGLPPDPAVVGERWREMWFDRLKNNRPLADQWLSHQRRDDFWKQGSVIEDYSAITCAVYAVGGWVDAYTNSVPRLLEGLTAPRKGLIGPWAHLYPHEGIPGPAIGFLQECLRWWDYWLKGTENDIMDEPMLRVWLPEGVPPRTFEAQWPGRWVAEEQWPPAGIKEQIYALDDGRLVDSPLAKKALYITGAQINGLNAGEWCPFNGVGMGMPINQRIDDGLSLCFTSAPLEQPMEIMGRPEARLRVSVDQPIALLAVRLCDVAPDGASRLITWGMLNLTHRESHENPKPLTPGKIYDVTVKLNVAAYRIDRGHRWRLAVSPTYWPHAWPSPKPVELTLYTGKGGELALPVRVPGKLDESLRPFGCPEGSTRLDIEWLRPEKSSKELRYDVFSGGLQLKEHFDNGRRIYGDGLVYDSVFKNIYSIIENEPLSAKIECKRSIEISRNDWITRVDTLSVMTSDEKHFHLTSVIDAYEGVKRVATKSWSSAISRKHV